MEPVPVLVVGAGTMGGNYARLLAAGRVPGAALAGVVDIDPARAASLAGASPLFSDLAEALRALQPGAAYIATPDALHREPVELCAAAGVAVLVEKPLATTVADVGAMLDAVEAAGIHAEVNYSNRWNPGFARARQAIAEGAIGEVRSFNVRLSNPRSLPLQRLAWSSQTTPAWFLMSHCLDLAFWMIGESPEVAYASGGKGVLSSRGVDTYDWVHAMLRFPGQRDAVLESSWILPDGWPSGIEFTFRVMGSDGVIDIDTTRQSLAVVRDRVEYPSTLAWAPQRLGSFVAALRGSPETVVTFDEAAMVTRALVAIHASLESRVAEDIPVVPRQRRSVV